MKYLDTGSISKLPSGYLRAIVTTGLAGDAGIVTSSEPGAGQLRVKLTYHLTQDLSQDDYQVKLALDFPADYFWAPHLTPQDGNIMEQHIFRTPALIARGAGRTVIVIPDVELMDASPVRWYMDLNAPQGEMILGMSESEISDHVLYKKKGGACYPAGKCEFGFYLLLFDQELENPFRPVLEFFWSRYGREHSDTAGISKQLMHKYIERTYNWAFSSWKDVVWQEFIAGGKRVGAPVFIVTAMQSPNYKGVPREREVRSVWNQAWFCSLRSATGLYRHARRTNNHELLQYARMTKELALAFPQENGLFDAVIATEMEQFTESGQTYQRSKGWDTRYFGNSDRNPFGKNVRQAPRHLLDMSFTARYMLIWYSELEQDERLLKYALRYADRLLELQDESGFFPGWVDSAGRALGVLDDSPESAMSSAFLFLCAQITGEQKYTQAALRSIEAVLEEIVPSGRWEDFETYWSCSRCLSDHVGRRIARNGMYKTCNFSMYFTALALVEAYKATEDMKYMQNGQLVLDELLMTQASWQPGFIPIPALGGFGVLNADAEWNDARQSLFAGLILEYADLLLSDEYKERALAALKASFAMMYCPENPQVKKQWEKVWPFFNEQDYGFNMENYGHDGRANAEGMGIGEFTIYDWGNGAAAEGCQWIMDHYPQLLP